MKRFLVPFAAAGAVAALAFPPFSMAWALWFALPPALLAARHASPGTAILGGFVFGMVQALVLLTWFFGLFGIFGLVLHLQYALFFALIFGAIQKITERFGTSSLIWASPAVWVAVECFRSEWYPLKFAWLTLGASQHANLPVLQIASIGGVYGISLLIAFANGSLAWFLDHPGRKRGAFVAAVAALVISLHAIPLPPVEAGDFKIAGLEGENGGFASRTRQFLERTPGVQLMIWPELAVGKESAGIVPGVPLLFGGKRRLEGREWENTLFLIRRDGTVAGTQVKSVPVPFFNDGNPAKGREPLEFDGVRIGAGICYDMDFPSISREFVRKGAQLLVFPTFDAAEWGDIQHEQHASLASLRAVEERRWLVRVASSGVSCIVDPWGRVVTSKDEIVGEVKLRSDATFYSTAGWMLPYLCMIAMVGLLVPVRRRPGL